MVCREMSVVLLEKVEMEQEQRVSQSRHSIDTTVDMVGVEF